MGEFTGKEEDKKVEELRRMVQHADLKMEVEIRKERFEGLPSAFEDGIRAVVVELVK